MAFIGSTRLDDGTTLYRWNLTQEDSGQLARECELQGLDPHVEAKAESRRREILAERLLLNRIVGHAALRHDENRAPRVDELGRHLSIAHTRQELVFAINSVHAVGVDLESYRDRVLRVRDGFLNGHERTWIAPDDLCAHVVAWTAKEAIFKVISRRDRVKSYRDDIVLDPFVLPKGLPPAVGAPVVTISHTAAFIERGDGDACRTTLTLTLTTMLSPVAVLTLARCDDSDCQII